MQWHKLDGFETIECEQGELRKLVESEDTQEGEEFVRCVCPRCKERNEKRGNLTYDKRNLSVNKDFTWGKCFRCEAVFRDKAAEFSREVDLEVLMDEKPRETFELCRIDTKTYDSAEFITNENAGGVYMHQRNPFYIIGRNFCRLKYKEPKIIIPYFDLHQKPYYYQFRYIDVSKSPTGSKYFNPPIEKKPVYIVPNFDGKICWNTRNTTILVEGALTAIALKLAVGDKINVAALLGKVPTLYQIQLLKHLGLLGKVYSMMDKSELSRVVVKKLGAEGIRSEIIPSSGADSEELLLQYGLQGFQTRLNSILDTGIRLRLSLVREPKLCPAEITRPVKIAVSI